MTIPVSLLLFSVPVNFNICATFIYWQMTNSVRKWLKFVVRNQHFEWWKVIDMQAISYIRKMCCTRHVLNRLLHLSMGNHFMSNMMTSSNGNIFRVTGPLCGEFTGPGEFPTQRPVTRSFDVFFNLRLNKRLSKQPWGWWFETLSRPLWRHCNEFKIMWHVITDANKWQLVIYRRLKTNIPSITDPLQKRTLNLVIILPVDSQISRNVVLP